MTIKHLTTSLIIFLALVSGLSAQEVDIYNPDADASEDIKEAIMQAAKEKKHVLVMVGGNWCPWCIRLNAFMQEDGEIDSTMNADYILVKVNYSKENKNEEVLAGLGYPQRFGFPVLVILDDQGERLHTQNSWFLEKEKSYDREKIFAMLKGWNAKAVNPGNY